MHPAVFNLRLFCALVDVTHSVQRIAQLDWNQNEIEGTQCMEVSATRPKALMWYLPIVYSIQCEAGSIPSSVLVRYQHRGKTMHATLLVQAQYCAADCVASQVGKIYHTFVAFVALFAFVALIAFVTFVPLVAFIALIPFIALVALVAFITLVSFVT